MENTLPRSALVQVPRCTAPAEPQLFPAACVREIRIGSPLFPQSRSDSVPENLLPFAETPSILPDISCATAPTFPLKGPPRRSPESLRRPVLRCRGLVRSRLPDPTHEARLFFRRDLLGSTQTLDGFLPETFHPGTARRNLLRAGHTSGTLPELCSRYPLLYLSSDSRIVNA